MTNFFSSFHFGYNSTAVSSSQNQDRMKKKLTPNSSRPQSFRDEASKSTSLEALNEQEKEQVKMLNNLARTASTADAAQKENIMNTMPNWNEFEKNGIIPSSSASKLAKFHNATRHTRNFEVTDAYCEYLQLFFTVLQHQEFVSEHKYILTHIVDMVRYDQHRYVTLCKNLDGSYAYGTFHRIIANTNLDRLMADRAAFFLSGLMSRSKDGTFEIMQIEAFLGNLISPHAAQFYNLTEQGKLDAAGNILKIDKYRKFVVRTPAFYDMLLRNLKSSNPANILYKASFCVWLLTFCQKFIEEMVNNGIIEAFCNILTEIKVEKVVRVGLCILRNICEQKDAAEIIIAKDLLQTLVILEFEKWRDNELYERLRNCRATLEGILRDISTYSRYCYELDKGKLKWGVSHSEKFWKENISYFDENEYQCIRMLVDLLHSDDPETVAVACYDLGEFTRLHPAGKLICSNLKMKQKITPLLTHRSRIVASHALLCIQKMILNRWESTENTAKILNSIQSR